MASPPAAWDCRVVPGRAMREPVKALSEARVGHPSVELADYRTEYRLLGPLEVVHRGEAVPTGGQRKRALLARLLLEANRTVSIDALVDALWGEHVPADGGEDGAHLRLAAPQGSAERGAADASAGLPARGRAGGRRPAAVRAAAQGGPRGAGRRRRRRGGRAPARPRARSGAGRRSASSRSRSPRPRPPTSTSCGCSPSRTGSTRSSRSAAIATSRASCRPSWRATRSASASPPADAGAVPAGKARRGARGLPRGARCAPRRAGDRPVGRPAELQYRILNQDPALDHASPAPAAPEPAPVPVPPPTTDSSAGRRSWRGSSRRSTERRPGMARPH